MLAGLAVSATVPGKEKERVKYLIFYSNSLAQRPYVRTPHLACPPLDWKVPGLHTTQESLPALFENWPAGQFEQLIAPAPLYVPLSQTGHVLWPVVDEYLPATHSAQLVAPALLTLLPAVQAV